MHIQHITYDECRKPASTAKRVREFISSKLRRHPDDRRWSVQAREHAERPMMIAWPTITLHFPTECHGAGTTTGDRSKTNDDGGIEKSTFLGSWSLLRRKSCYSGSRDQGLGPIINGDNDRGKVVERVPSIRRVIRDGKLERAMPPTETFYSGQKSAPLITFALRKGSSFGPKENNLYHVRADASIFRCQFDSPLHQSFSPSRHSNISIPETAPGTLMHTPEGNESRRMSDFSYGEQINSPKQQINPGGKGHNFWRPGPLDPCRLCKTGSVVGIKGLCKECEEDFARPDTLAFDPESGFGDKIEPPPPLKIAGTLVRRRSATRSRKERENEGVKRETSFYEFWDDILRDDKKTS